jgi:uncharacterized phosphosugar-binding protein
MLMDEFFDQVSAYVQKVRNTQGPAIEAAALLVLDTLKLGHRTFVFGSGHSNLLTEEIVLRAGELPIFSPIFVAGLLPTDYPYHRGGLMERISGIAAAALDSIPVEKRDTLIVISTSGRNAVPVEMALEARQRGLRVIALTSVEFSSQVTSRHQSGKRLYELADIVIDSCSPQGDAVVRIPGTHDKIGPLSTILGGTILHALSCKICDLILDLGMTPPVLVSGNIDDAEEYDEKSVESFKEFIRHL